MAKKIFMREIQYVFYFNSVFLIKEYGKHYVETLASSPKAAAHFTVAVNVAGSNNHFLSN